MGFGGVEKRAGSLRRRGRAPHPRGVFRWSLVVGVGVLGLSAAGYLGMVGYHWHRFAGVDCRLTVLMFHAVVPDSVTPARYLMQVSEFARQMDELKAAGASTRHVSQILPVLGAGQSSGACPFGDREVVLTFDLDGPVHHPELAVPILTRNNLLGIFFVPTAHLDAGAIEEEDIRALAEAGMMIGSHGHVHRDMRRFWHAALLDDLDRSRTILESLTSLRVSMVASPGGRYNREVVETVGAAGYRAFFNSDPCYVLASTSPYRLCRIEIRGDGGMTALDAVTKPRSVAIQATNWRFKRGVEAVVGPTVFGWLSRFRTRLRG